MSLVFETGDELEEIDNDFPVLDSKLEATVPSDDTIRDDTTTEASLEDGQDFGVDISPGIAGALCVGIITYVELVTEILVTVVGPWISGFESECEADPVNERVLTSD